jgi:trigger factor
MQVTETLNEGLKRKLAVVIPAKDLNERLDAKLDEIKGKASLKGFRPGKVPVTHLKKMYGRSAMSEVMTDAINSTVTKTLEERAERAAARSRRWT